jgi:hypothetical protein
MAWPIVAARGAQTPARKKAVRDGAPPQEGTTEVKLGPLPGRDVWVPSPQRSAQAPAPVQQAPTPPVWPNGQPVYPGQPQSTYPQPGSPVPPVAGNGTTITPLGPGFTESPGSQLPVKEPTAREERPLTIAGGMGGIEGRHASLHYNLTDKTSIGATAGSINADGVGIGSYGLNLRQYVASEKNWGIYVQPGVHALTTPDGVKPAGSGQLGLEWRTNSGITFNVFGGGAYTAGDKLRPTAGFSVGLSF